MLSQCWNTRAIPQKVYNNLPLTFIMKFLFIIFIYARVPLCIYTNHVCAGAIEGQKKVMDHQELEL